MNREKFSEAMNQIDDRFYEEANSYTPGKKNHSWVKWCAAAACAAVAFSGTAVLAKNYAFPEKIAESMKLVTIGTPDATPEEQELYAWYSQEVDSTLELSGGKLILDGICYDQTYMCVSFQFYPNKWDLEPGSTLSDSMCQSLTRSMNLRFRKKDETAVYDSLGGSEGALGGLYTWDDTVQMDGSAKGTALLDVSKAGISQGDIIECFQENPNRVEYTRKIEPGEDTAGLQVVHTVNGIFEYRIHPSAVVSEFTVDTAPEVVELATDDLNFPEQMEVSSLTLSSMSLCLNGAFSPSDELSLKALEGWGYNLLIDNTTIVMKDGSVIKRAPGYSGAHYNSTPEQSSFTYQVLFEAPFNLEDAEYIHMDGTSMKTFEDFDLWIPIHQE